jgi:hypothetical protein
VKKRFLLRLNADLYDLLEKWAADELRSVNGQIEYLLTEASRKAGRLRRPASGNSRGPETNHTGA